MENSWQTELARGLFVLAGAAVAFFGILFSQWRQANRDRQNDARALRDAKRERLEESYTPVLLAARAMWELVIRHGKKPDEVDLQEERDHLARLWQRATTDVEESLVRLSLEADSHAEAANRAFDRIRASFYAYLGHREQEGADQSTKNADRILATRQEVYSGLGELENLSRGQLRRLSQPLPAELPRRRRWWVRMRRGVVLEWRIQMRRKRRFLRQRLDREER